MPAMEGKGHEEAIIKDAQDCLLKIMLHAILLCQAAITWPQHAAGAELLLMLFLMMNRLLVL